MVDRHAVDVTAGARGVAFEGAMSSPDFGFPLDTLLRSLRRAPTEIALQSAIAATFEADGLSFEREVRLSDRDIIDFLVGGVGVEVKIDGSLSAVTRQLHRYAQSDRVALLVLVTTRMRHRAVPRELNGKRVDVVHLIGGSL